ncbi:MAG: hypothetical protein ACO1OX_07665 [Novosphingobium sp.]
MATPAPVTVLAPRHASLSPDLWKIRKIEEASADAYAACSEKERRDGDITLTLLHLALHAPAEPEFTSHG